MQTMENITESVQCDEQREENLNLSEDISFCDEQQEDVGVCEDCGRRGKLIETPACADYQCLGLICCYKMVCQSFCVYECPDGHPNEVYNDDGWIHEETCCICRKKWQPRFTWWGISIKEYYRRYGY